MPGDPKPKGVLSGEYEIQTAEFVSKCDDLFATSRAGTKCRAEGNLANPPTHNAAYLDVEKALGISSLPASGVYRWTPSNVSDILMHELTHAVDILSSVTQGDQIRDSQDIVVTDLFDWDAMGDRQEFLDQLEDRLIRAGGSDDRIDDLLRFGSGAWDHYIGAKWLTKRNEQVAVSISLASLLDEMGISGPDFIRLNLADDPITDDASGIIDYALVVLMYGLLDEEGAIGLEGIKGKIR
jgi:hypothetical protein